MVLQKNLYRCNQREAGKPGLNAKSIKNIHSILHKALEQAVKIGYIRSNPADACTLPRVVKKEIKPLDEDATALFIKAIEGHQFETLYLVTLFTGLRQGEVMGLSWDCVDFAKGTLNINKLTELGRHIGSSSGCLFFIVREEQTATVRLCYIPRRCRAGPARRCPNGKSYYCSNC